MRRRSVRISFVLLAILIIAAAALWRLSWMEPSWYDPPDPRDAAAAEFGDHVEQALVEQTHRLREGEEPWRIRIREEQINAWLATRLPKWFAHEKKLEWPDELGPPQVRLLDDSIDLAIPVGSRSAPATRRVFVVRLAPEVNGDELSIRTVGFAMGRIGVWGSPLDRIMELANDPALEAVMRDEGTREVLDLLSGGRALAHPAAKLADGRLVRLIEMRLGPGMMDLTLVTEAPGRE